MNKLIVNSIEAYKDGFFTCKPVAHNIIKVTESEKGDSKYIIIENAIIYQSISEFIEHAENIRRVIPNDNTSTLRIPYFAGVTGYDLGNFLLDENKSIDPALDINIDFPLKPCDFNINGIKYFVDYLEGVYNQSPVFKGNNNFKDYLGYFIDSVEKMEWKINLIIPPIITSMLPERKSIQRLFSEIDKAKNSKKGL